MINAIIPARSGSKNPPNKNIYDVKGYPLIAYSIIACKLCNKIDRVIVSTDSLEIAKISIDYGAETPFIRPSAYSTDTSSDYGFLNHFFDNVNCEEVALIRPTSPLRNPSYMEGIIDYYFKHKNSITGLRTAQEMKQPVYKMFRINDGGFFEGLFEDYNGIKDYTNLPRQTFPVTYNPNGHIDIVKRETIKNGSVFGDRILASISPNLTDIDGLEDFEKLKFEINGVNDHITKHIRRVDR